MVYECCLLPVAGYPFCPEHGGDPVEEPRRVEPTRPLVPDAGGCA